MLTGLGNLPSKKGRAARIVVISAAIDFIYRV